MWIIILAIAAGWSLCVIYNRYNANNEVNVKKPTKEDIALDMQSIVMDNLSNDKVYLSMEYVADYLLDNLLLIQNKYIQEKDRLSEDEWVELAIDYSNRMMGYKVPEDNNK